jgi:hypothetical protein
LNALAEANVHLGRIDAALEGLQDLPLTANALLQAKLSLLCADARAAEEYARAALPAIAGNDRYRYHALISQARRARGALWWPPPETMSLAHRSWERIAMDAEHACHLAQTPMRGVAERLARAAQTAAEELGFCGLAARSAAALSATARGSETESRRWRARAIERLLQTQDRLLAVGLFARGGYDAAGGMDPFLSGVLYERLCLIVPQLLGESERQRAAVCALLTAVFDLPQSWEYFGTSLERATASVANTESAFVDYAEQCLEPMTEMLTLARVALTGDSWSGTRAIFSEALAESARALRPATRRAIPVAVPSARQSQQPRIEHLINDEGRCAGERGSIEAFADLRVRLVSLRSDSGAAVPR